MKVIGVTGTIGSGKSTVSAHLRDRGFRVLDADEMARAVAREESVIREVGARFGEGFLTEDGAIDRKKLAETVFSDPAKKKTLEDLITKRVVGQVSETIEAYRNAEGEEKPDTVFLDAPLLFETGADRLCDETWIITADPETIVQRTMARDGATREEVLARAASQMSTEDKIRRADVVIGNNGTKEELLKKIDRII